MIIPIGLSNDCLSDTLGGDTAVLDAVHQRLVRSIAQHCLLLHATREDEDNFIASIGSAPQAVRAIWAAALGRLVRRVALSGDSMALNQIENSNELQKGWPNQIKLAAVEPTRGELLGIPTGQISVLDTTGIELVRHDLFESSEAIQNLQSLCTIEIPSGTPRETIWNERFSLLAQTSEFITILDRHALESYASSNASGLEWILKKIDGSGKSKVHLICGIDRHSETELIAAAQKLKGDLAAGGIERLSLSLAQDYHFGDHSHARHIRFDRRLAVLIEPGLHCLSKTRTSSSFPCFPLRTEDAEARESAVLDQSETVRRVI